MHARANIGWMGGGVHGVKGSSRAQAALTAGLTYMSFMSMRPWGDGQQPCAGSTHSRIDVDEFHVNAALGGWAVAVLLLGAGRHGVRLW